MSRLTSFIRDIFARKEDGNPLQHGNYVGYAPQMFLPPDVRLQAEDALTLSVVWACVDYISKSLAQCDWDVFQRDASGRRTIQHQDNLCWLLNQRPNKDTTAMAIREAIAAQALVFGDGYWEIQRDNANRPYALFLLPSILVKPIRNEAGDMAYEYRPDGGNGGVRVIPQENMYHLRGPSLLSLLGESIVTRAARSIAIAKFADEFALSFYANGTIVGGVLETTRALKQDEREALKAEFKSAHRGAVKAHTPLVLGGGTKWTPIEVDASKAQVVESRRHSVDDICRFFGIPPTVIGHLDHASWNNVEHLGMVTVRDGLRPWAKRMEQEANYKLVGARSPRMTEIDLKPLQLGDFKTRAEGYATMRRNGAMTANEWRELEGMNGIGDEGDLMLVEKNMTLLEEDALMPVPPTPPAAPEPTDPEVDAEEDADEPTDDEAVTEALNAHQRRINARREDLVRAGKTESEIAANLEKLQVKAVQELAQLLPSHSAKATTAAVASVTAGIEPSKAARHLLESR